MGMGPKKKKVGGIMKARGGKMVEMAKKGKMMKGKKKES